MNMSFEAIHALLEKRCGSIDYCSRYAEPGYDDPAKSIIFANWNRVHRRVYSWLENHGYSLEFNDEWMIDHESDRAYRTVPDSYSWKPSFILTEDGTIIGQPDIEDGDYLVSYIDYLVNEPSRRDMFNVDWIKQGFVKVNQEPYVSGFHLGQTDDPETIMRMHRAIDPMGEFLFSLDEASQFEREFSLWRRSVSDV